jgi:hypothetical protein
MDLISTAENVIRLLLIVGIAIYWAAVYSHTLAGGYTPPCCGCGNRHAYGPCPDQPKDPS